MSPGLTHPKTWLERYESLRCLALGNDQILGTDPLGLIVLVRCGLVSWMRRWSLLGSTCNPTAVRPEEPALPPSPSWQRQLTNLLAQITAQHVGLHPNP